jgi:hypothetical protein
MSNCATNMVKLKKMIVKFHKKILLLQINFKTITITAVKTLYLTITIF